MNILDKLFEKRNISEVTKLDEGEKHTYDNWRKILSEGEITVEKINEFCQSQVSIIEGKWRELDNTAIKNERLIITHTIYKTIIDAISKPQKERENLEQYLQKLLDSPNML